MLKHFQKYLVIFRDIDAYPATPTGAQLGGRREAIPTFIENRKKCLDFGKKDIDCVNLWVKFFIQNLVLRVSWRKNSKIFPCGAFRTVGLFKTLWNVDQAYSRLCLGNYPAIFRHIQNLMQRLHKQKVGIFWILEYSELFLNCIPPHIQNPAIFTKNCKYSGFRVRHISWTFSKIIMQFLAKIVRNYNYFSEALHLRSFIGF